MNDPKNKLASGINSFDIPSLYIDKSGNIWVASWYSGIYLLKNGTDRFINFNRKTHPKIFKSNRIASFSEDLNGKIWIGTFQSGLISYEPISETFTKHDSQVFVKTVLLEQILEKCWQIPEKIFG